MKRTLKNVFHSPVFFTAIFQVPITQARLTSYTSERFLLGFVPLIDSPVRPVAGLEFGFTQFYSVKRKQGTCRVHRKGGGYSNSPCTIVEHQHNIGNYANIAGKFGIVFGEPDAKRIKKDYVMLSAYAGALIPMHKYLKYPPERQQVRLLPSFICGVDLSIVFYSMYIGLGYQYIQRMETHQIRAHDLHYFTASFGFAI